MKFPWCEKDYYYQHQHQQLIVAIVLLLPLILKTTMSTKSSKCLLGTSVISRITASTTTRYGGGSHHDNLNQMITYSSPAAARRIRIPPSSVLNMNKQQSSSFAAKGVDKNIKNTSISLQVSKVKQQQQQQPESTTMTSLPPLKQHAHRIILMRHGESEFNNANIFTGWCDVALTPRGIVEAIEAGQVFASHDLEFVQCYSSLLTRSIATAYRTVRVLCNY